MTDAFEGCIDAIDFSRERPRGATPVPASDCKRPFWAKCRPCAHIWVVCYLPMDMTTASKLMAKAACPNCGDAKPGIANQDNGVLLEGGE